MGEVNRNNLSDNEEVFKILKKVYKQYELYLNLTSDPQLNENMNYEIEDTELHDWETPLTLKIRN